jgi:hypothetical protein
MHVLVNSTYTHNASPATGANIEHERLPITILVQAKYPRPTGLPTVPHAAKIASHCAVISSADNPLRDLPSVNHFRAPHRPELPAYFAYFLSAAKKKLWLA